MTLSFDENASAPAPEASDPTGTLPLRPATALRDDLRVPWGWSDIVLLVPVAIGGIVFFLVLIAIALAALHVSFAQLQKSASALTFILVSAQILMEIALMGYLAAQMRWQFHLPFWRAIGWHPVETRGTSRGMAYLGLIFGGFFLALFVSLASSAFPPKHSLPIEMVLKNRPLLIVYMLTAVSVAPVVEETVFRGYLYPVAARSFGVVGGILVTGVMFGLLHGGQLWGGWWQIGLLIVVGIVFTYARAATRTVVTSFLLHMSYNSLQVVALMISIYGPRHLPHVR